MSGPQVTRHHVFGWPRSCWDGSKPCGTPPQEPGTRAESRPRRRMLGSFHVRAWMQCISAAETRQRPLQLTSPGRSPYGPAGSDGMPQGHGSARGIRDLGPELERAGHADGLGSEGRVGPEAPIRVRAAPTATTALIRSRHGPCPGPGSPGPPAPGARPRPPACTWRLSRRRSRETPGPTPRHQGRSRHWPGGPPCG